MGDRKVAAKERALLNEISQLAGWINTQKNGIPKTTGVTKYRRKRFKYKTSRYNKNIPKKNEYCSIYIRKGACGVYRCPYIHDRSKIKICSKFLKGDCKDPRCRFQHKIIKEQMPVCSYFLRGICTNESCPYSHVNVNHNAAICPAFLKGYCPEGNYCKLKHTKECQSYNKNGYCPDKLNGRCNLQHNKTSQHGKKGKKSKNVKEEEKTDDPPMDYFALFPKFIQNSDNDNSESSENSDNSENNVIHRAKIESDASLCSGNDGEDISFHSDSESDGKEIPVPDFLKL